MSTGYEFKADQNELIGRLASKMSFVGLVNVVLGVLYLLSAVLLMAAIFQDKLPPEIVQRVPEDVRSKLPNNTYLWALFINTIVASLIFLAVGLWTRASAASFQEIVNTSGRDISHLMTALGSLHKMYSLIYTIIVLTLLVSILAIAMQLYMRYGS
jgi:hypothetical protein